MWQNSFLKRFERFNEFLDGADKQVSTATVGTKEFKELREAAGDALKSSLEGARAATKELGIVEGWKDLTSQISSDLSILASAPPGQDGRSPTEEAPDPEAPPTPLGSDGTQVATSQPAQAESSRTSQRMLDVQARVRELEEAEEEHLRECEKLKMQLEEVEAEAKKMEQEGKEQAGHADEEAENSSLAGVYALKEDCTVSDASTAAEEEEERERMMEMQREFDDKRAAVDGRVASLKAEKREAMAMGEPMKVELDFWREKVQRMLAAQGLKELPERVRRRAQRSDDGKDDDSSSAEEREKVTAKAQRDLAAAEAEYERISRECADERLRYESLEARLAELMRRSDEAVEAEDASRRRHRELEGEVAVAEAEADAEEAAAKAAEKRLLAAQEASDEAKRAQADALQREREAHEAAVAAERDNSEVTDMRKQLDALKASVEEQRRENASLEAHLRKHRAAAAADLERAVPLTSASCWHSIDGPSLKVVTLLVRSSCLRRTFAVHMLGTYIWLFFLIFWLEKH